MRVQVRSIAGITDGRAAGLQERLALLGLRAPHCTVADVTILDGLPVSPEFAADFLSDPIAQTVSIDADVAPDHPWTVLVEVTFRPGVANPVATSIRDAIGSELGALPEGALVQTARQFFFGTDASFPALARELHNPLIQSATIISREEWERGGRPPARYPGVHASPVPPVETIAVSASTDEQLLRLSSERLLALTLPEMQAIRDYYAQEETRQARSAAGLPEDATDVELEMLAQTWSEHCKHKIFAARVEYREGDGAPEVIDSLYETYIKATTREVADPDFVKSVFHDNAGVVRFDDETLICFKAETHNSPSALDPYGGAITGIVGVNRDILGTGKGARPLFNTNVLCFGYPETDPASLPEGLLAPRVVLEGVHRGIVDGGNQSGIPVAAGAFLFDESYTGKPLVFCGTGGILPAKILGEDAWEKHVDPGDVAVMVGGLVGKDGIHGATFSSLALDESSPTSAVQIAEPITQRKVWDFLLEARDAGLYKGITDNGAGGLSSSLGEMARESGGITIDLDGCPLKYEGLAAWEILVSESQERMSLAVDPARLAEFLALAWRRGVTAAAVGAFTDDGFVRIRHQGETVGLLTLQFLHDGLPQMVIPAHWPSARLSGAGEPDTAAAAPAGLREALLTRLRDPNVASKEHLIRQYDHEVQAGSVVKPHVGPQADGPSDGAVLRPRLGSSRGITVTHGICPVRSERDTYEMAIAAVDEAVRAHIALGGDPGQMAALDNFCWPDPVLSNTTPDGPFKMAQLVRACRGLADACRAYRLPLISGKDSMKNDARLGGRKVSILPTLLISLTGIVEDVAQSMTTHFTVPGDLVLRVAAPEPRLAGEAQAADARLHRAAANGRFTLYQALHRAIVRGLLHSVHDVSDGGILVAAAESAIGGRLGADLDPSALPEPFAEPLGTFVASCAPEHLPELRELLGGDAIAVLGKVTRQPQLRLGEEVGWTLPELVDAWKSLVPHPEDRTLPVHTAKPAVSARASGELLSSSVGPESPLALVLTGYGINADLELEYAFSTSGARTRRVHVNDLLAQPSVMQEAAIFAVPGGFSYGDHVGSGLMLAHRLRAIRGELSRFRDEEGLILGICNGFQVLVKLGILPDLEGEWRQEVSLVHNLSGRFEDSWVSVSCATGTGSPWLDGIEVMDVPVRHGEGRFVTGSRELRERLAAKKRIAFRYTSRNPNGSDDDVAGIVDRTGRVLGMMPHPEAFPHAQNHPNWRDRTVARDGLELFRNAVRAARRV